MRRQLHDPRHRRVLIERSDELGFTPAELAAELRVSLKTVERLFRGETKLHRGKRYELARILKLSYATVNAELSGSQGPHVDRVWWSSYVTLEKLAVSIAAYQPLLVPGLLQTQRYAMAMLGDDELVARRLDRQLLITRHQDPVDLLAVIDESVLRRPIGGPDVLAEQLERLAVMAERPNVTVLVLPFDSPEQPAYWGALTIVRFERPGGLVYLEHKGGHRSLDTYQEIEEHTDVFYRIEELALPSAESTALILQRAKELSA